MVFKVNNDSCIGCGMCIDMCPEVFRYNDLGISEVKDDCATSEDIQSKAKEAMDLCPVDAIEMD